MQSSSLSIRLPHDVRLKTLNLALVGRQPKFFFQCFFILFLAVRTLLYLSLGVVLVVFGVLVGFVRFYKEK